MIKLGMQFFIWVICRSPSYLSERQVSINTVSMSAYGAKTFFVCFLLTRHVSRTFDVFFSLTVVELQGIKTSIKAPFSPTIQQCSCCKWKLFTLLPSIFEEQNKTKLVRGRSHPFTRCRSVEGQVWQFSCDITLNGVEESIPLLAIKSLEWVKSAFPIILLFHRALLFPAKSLSRKSKP